MDSMSTINKDELEPADSWEKLGDGGFGTVFRVFWKTQKKHVAVKKLFKIDNFQEVEILKKLMHPNIVTFFGFVHEENTDLLILLELCELGSLKSFLEQHKDAPIPPGQRLDWMLEAALPIEYLRQFNIEHMDIKTDNYVINSNMVLKLTDFGLSQVLEDTKSYSSEAGSWRWMPPERFKDHKLSPKFHIYALALVFWCLFTRSKPYAEYKTEFAVVEAVQKGVRPVIPSFCPKPIADLIEACWHDDRSLRPDITTVIRILLQHTSASLAAGSQTKLIRKKASDIKSNTIDLERESSKYRSQRYRQPTPNADADEDANGKQQKTTWLEVRQKTTQPPHPDNVRGIPEDSESDTEEEMYYVGSDGNQQYDHPTPHDSRGRPRGRGNYINRGSRERPNAARPRRRTPGDYNNSPATPRRPKSYTRSNKWYSEPPTLEVSGSDTSADEDVLPLFFKNHLKAGATMKITDTKANDRIVKKSHKLNRARKEVKEKKTQPLRSEKPPLLKRGILEDIESDYEEDMDYHDYESSDGSQQYDHPGPHDSRRRPRGRGDYFINQSSRGRPNAARPRRPSSPSDYSPATPRRPESFTRSNKSFSLFSPKQEREPTLDVSGSDTSTEDEDDLPMFLKKPGITVTLNDARGTNRVLKKSPTIVDVVKKKERKPRDYICHDEDHTDRPDSVLEVSGFNPSTGEDTLMMYFETTRRSGGGEIKDMDLNRKNNEATITFVDQGAINRIVKISHKLDGAWLEVREKKPQPHSSIDKHPMFIQEIQEDAERHDEKGMYSESSEYGRKYDHPAPHDSRGRPRGRGDYLNRVSRGRPNAARPRRLPTFYD